jgi:hypothetical protein
MVNAGTEAADTTKATYSISGNTLTLNTPGAAAQRFTPVLYDDLLTGVVGGDGAERDPELIGTTWVSADGAEWSFAPAGMTLVMYEDEVDYELYSWSTSGGNLILTPFLVGGDAITYAYSISGDELTINGVTYTKVDEEDGYEDYEMYKSRLSKSKPKFKLPGIFK